MRAVRWGARALSVVLLACLVLPFGWTVVTGDRFVTVTGESMRPEYEVGDILSVRRPTGDELRTVGGLVVVTMSGSSRMYVHRVVEVEEDGAWLQGDNNVARDTTLVTADQVVGAPRLALHGWAAAALRVLTSVPTRIALSVAAILLLLVPLPAGRAPSAEGRPAPDAAAPHTP
jgi:signal peptidase I